LLSISVKGSQDGGWGLNQGYKTKYVSYHAAVDKWVKAHRNQVVYCLVQFKDVKLGECPRVYLATIEEIANFLKNSRNGNGETILWENHTYVRGAGANTTDKIPAHWRFDQKRVEQILEQYAIS